MKHRAKKRFGQNFLVDRNIVDKIIDTVQPLSHDCLVEIGAGHGALSCPLLEHVARLHVIEIDRDVVPQLIENCSESGRMTIHQQDVLKFDFEAFRAGRCPREKIRVIGNLPYNISTPVLFRLLAHRQIIQDMHFMLQKEVVDRITARTHDSNYGRLGVMLQTWFNVQAMFVVPPGCFRPVPQVDSAVIRLVPNTASIPLPDDYARLVKQAFSQRRKTLRNTLKGMCSESCFEAAGIDSQRRPQELSVQEYLQLHQVLTGSANTK